MKISVTKQDAATQQIDTAVRLWFGDGDPVSIHTLTMAAYQIAADLSARIGGIETLFNTSMIREDRRKEWIHVSRAAQNFFKHAYDPEDVQHIFETDQSEKLFVFALTLFQSLSWPRSDEQSILALWHALHNPHLLTDEGRSHYIDPWPVAILDTMRQIKKADFYSAGMALFKHSPARSHTM